MMEKFTVVNYCFGLLGVLLLQGVLNVEGRSIYNSGSKVFNSKEDTDPETKILTLLLRKGLVPFEKDDALGLQQAQKLSELQEVRAYLARNLEFATVTELQALRDDLALEREIAANLAEDKSVYRKRGEPCFWKYCV